MYPIATINKGITRSALVERVRLFMTFILYNKKIVTAGIMMVEIAARSTIFILIFW